jgi:hypothetical protein
MVHISCYRTNTLCTVRVGETSHVYNAHNNRYRAVYGDRSARKEIAMIIVIITSACRAAFVVCSKRISVRSTRYYAVTSHNHEHTTLAALPYRLGRLSVGPGKPDTSYFQRSAGQYCAHVHKRIRT